MNFIGELPAGIQLLQLDSVYFVGIRGVGMAALAVLLKEAGVKVAGADLDESFVTDQVLAQANIFVQSFDQADLGDAQAVVYSGAHKGESHPLVQLAQQRGLTCLTHAQALGLLTQERETIAVCGVGGKSTTSAFLATLFDRAGSHPSYAVGVGTIPNLGRSGHWSTVGNLFIVEADEYVADPQHDITPRFLYLRPSHVIATSLRFDHPDVYKSLADTQEAFRSFFALIPEDGWLVVDGDDVQLAECLPQKEKILRVGEGEQNNVRLRFLPVVNGEGSVQLIAPGLPCDGWVLQLQLPGRHNLRNAAFGAALASVLGIHKEDAASAAHAFLSTPRRFEFKGKNRQGARFFDDYAHHPHELQAVSAALMEWYEGQTLVMAFQPHTFSRTKALFEEFVTGLAQFPGEVILLPIFASAREAFDPLIRSENIQEALLLQGKQSRVLANQEELAQYFAQLPENTIAITTGAGDIYKVYDELVLTQA